MYIGVGIDTVRFKVQSVGFDSWLKKNSLALVEYGSNSFSSKNLKSKVEAKIAGTQIKKYSYVGTVKFNNGGNQSLVQSIVVTRSNEMMKRERSRTYIVEIAGLHQPQRDNISTVTYKMLNQLLHKYDIFQVDLAFDFESLHIVTKERFCKVFDLKSGQVRKYGSPATLYTSGRGNKDLVLYNKSSKAKITDGYGSDAGFHWYRLEIALQFGKLSKAHIKSLSTSKVIERNRVFLEFILEKEATSVFALEIINELQVLNNKPRLLNTSFVEMQVAKLLNLRKPLPTYED